MVKIHATYLQQRHVRADSPSGYSTEDVTVPSPGRTWDVTARWAHLRDGCLVYGQTGHHEREEIIPLGLFWSLVIDRTGDASGSTTA